MGRSVEHDGCLFAWLNNQEVQELLTELSKVDGATLENFDLDELHDELIESLQEVVERDAQMFIGAS